jgi:hypothetical protein
VAIEGSPFDISEPELSLRLPELIVLEKLAQSFYLCSLEQTDQVEMVSHGDALIIWQARNR